MLPCCELHEHGLRLFVRATPSASADAIKGLSDTTTARKLLNVRVTAAPEDGKANKAIIALLAKKLKIAKSAVELVSGETAREKQFVLHGSRDALLSALQPYTE